LLYCVVLHHFVPAIDQASTKRHLKPMKSFFVSVCIAIVVHGGSAFAQSDFPRTTLRILVPFAPGGSPDIMARTLGAKAAEGLGREVITENRTGAGGNIAIEAAAKSPPDGHTMLMCTFGCATNPFLFDK